MRGQRILDAEACGAPRGCACSRRSSASFARGSEARRPAPRRSPRCRRSRPPRHRRPSSRRGEALGDEELRQRLVRRPARCWNISEFCDEFALALLAGIGLGQDVDARWPVELAGETDILAAAADRQRQLIVGHHHLDAARPPRRSRRGRPAPAGARSPRRWPCPATRG